jgi:hypothetical protein
MEKLSVRLYQKKKLGRRSKPDIQARNEKFFMDKNMRKTTEAEMEFYRREFIHTIAGTFGGKIRICGGGSSLWDDYEKSKAFGGDVMCVNVAGMFVPHPVHHLFSWHADRIGPIKEWRTKEIPDDKSIVHATAPHPYVDYIWNFSGGTSTSGITAVELAWLLGYRRIMLVGIPMDNSGYFYQRKHNPSLWDKWRKRELRDIGQKVKWQIKSFSGYTKELYGEPPEDWKLGGG